MKKPIKYQKYINKIQKIHGKNNINWMNILRLAFKYAPKSKCNYEKNKFR